jgi:hypothetical protein
MLNVHVTYLTVIPPLGCITRYLFYSHPSTEVYNTLLILQSPVHWSVQHVTHFIVTPTAVYNTFLILQPPLHWCVYQVTYLHSPAHWSVKHVTYFTVTPTAV